MPNVVESLKAFRKRISQSEECTTELNELNKILEMTSVQFGQEDLAILIKSYLLGEEILLVSNPSSLQQFEGEYVTYLAEELEAIYNHSPEFIKRVHKLKKLCGGQISSKWN